MIKAIEKLKNFGVFGDYSMPADTNPFTELNIIYGWNYSGKTTISRVFQSIEARELSEDFSEASFAVTLTDDSIVNENNLEDCPAEVRVFNSDFVDSNLRWDGESFDPILLLGDESIDAEKELKRNAAYLERCRHGFSQKNASVGEIDNEVREAKTKKASQIKNNLSLVAAFNATHLNKLLQIVEIVPKSFLVDTGSMKPLLMKALASDSDKPPIIEPVSLKGGIQSALTGVPDLLAHQPALTNTIDHLTKHSEVAEWIKAGLVIHADKNLCEFCGNEIELARLTALKSHFSKDLIDHEDRLNATLNAVEKAKLAYSPRHEKDFHDVLRSEVSQAQDRISELVAHHNSQLEKISVAIRQKLKSQFDRIASPSIDSSLDSKITQLMAVLNKIIKRNNGITQNFDAEKEGAIEKLKLHYAAEFCVEQNLDQMSHRIAILSAHKDKYEEVGLRLKARNLELEAKISQAQKGREELNHFIGKFLSDSNIQIDVDNVSGQDRFRLTRGGKPAKCLSEGEKTAIAFAFFLTKLREVGELENLVVCIDDPVSSLDSNHLFQLNAVIQSFFFKKDINGSKWILSVKQLFVSTHNFEFLGLLKSLPIRKDQRRNFYFVKRLGDTSATFTNMPESIKKYSSEYQYLWSVIHGFHESEEKDDISILLALPNAVRRFLELYTYTKIPCETSGTVTARAKIIFGAEKSTRILKVLHHFSHSNSIHGIAQNSDLMCDIENVVCDLVAQVKSDSLHYDALMESVS